MIANNYTGRRRRVAVLFCLAAATALVVSLVLIIRWMPQDESDSGEHQPVPEIPGELGTTRHISSTDTRASRSIIAESPTEQQVHNAASELQEMQGIVIRYNGDPAIGARLVYSWQNSKHPEGRQTATATTERGGRFNVKVISTAQLSVGIKVDGSTEVFHRRHSFSKFVTLVIPSNDIEIRGIVIDGAGRLLSGCELSYVLLDGISPHKQFGKSDREGAFALRIGSVHARKQICIRAALDQTGECGYYSGTVQTAAQKQCSITVASQRITCIRGDLKERADIWLRAKNDSLGIHKGPTWGSDVDRLSVVTPFVEFTCCVVVNGGVVSEFAVDTRVQSEFIVDHNVTRVAIAGKVVGPGGAVVEDAIVTAYPRQARLVDGGIMPGYSATSKPLINNEFSVSIPGVAGTECTIGVFSASLATTVEERVTAPSVKLELHIELGGEICLVEEPGIDIRIGGASVSFRRIGDERPVTTFIAEERPIVMDALLPGSYAVQVQDLSSMKVWSRTIDVTAGARTVCEMSGVWK